MNTRIYRKSLENDDYADRKVLLEKDQRIFIAEAEKQFENNWLIREDWV